MYGQRLLVAALFLVVASAGLLAYSVWSASGDCRVRVDRPDLTVMDAVPGTTRQLEFVIVNDGPHSMQLLGAEPT